MKKKPFTSTEAIAFIHEVNRQYEEKHSIPLLLNTSAGETGRAQKLRLWKFEGVFQPSRTVEHFTFVETKESDHFKQTWKLHCSQGMKEFADRCETLTKLLVDKIVEIKRYDQV